MQLSTLKVMVMEKDHDLKTSYETYFSNFTEFELVSFQTQMKKALNDVKKLQPDIIISEMDLLELSGLEAITKFKKKAWNVNIIMMSEINDFSVVKQAFKKGAQGFLTKELTPEKLYNALNCIKEDGAAISNDIVKQFIATFQRKTYKFFSERENQIVDYLCKGATYKMIAEKLFVTPSTVNFHIQNIYLKLDVNSKSEALLKLEQL